MASLGKDLAAIRKKRNLSVDDIHNATKIPKHIIQSIEDNTIFTDLDENITYIRSYVRSYARALSIDDQQIVYALDKEELGSYNGSLLEMGEEKGGESTDFEEEAVETPVSGTGEAAGEETDTEEVEELSSDNEEEAEPKPEKVPAQTPAQKYSESRDTVDWVDMGRQFQPQAPKSKVWIGVLAGLIVCAFGLYFFLNHWNGGGSPTPAVNESEGTLQEDSLQLNLVPPVGTDSLSANDDGQNKLTSASLESLPDTLTMVVYAAFGKLEPVRVYTDIMNSINPYWIEEGHAMRFDFVNTFRLRGQYNNLVLVLNGHAIENALENFYDPDTRRLEIHRSFFENGEKWLQPAPDSLGIGISPPEVIKDHPTFN